MGRCSGAGPRTPSRGSGAIPLVSGSPRARAGFRRSISRCPGPVGPVRASRRSEHTPRAWHPERLERVERSHQLKHSHQLERDSRSRRGVRHDSVRVRATRRRGEPRWRNPGIQPRSRIEPRRRSRRHPGADARVSVAGPGARHPADHHGHRRTPGPDRDNPSVSADIDYGDRSSGRPIGLAIRRRARHRRNHYPPLLGGSRSGRQPVRPRCPSLVAPTAARSGATASRFPARHEQFPHGRFIIVLRGECPGGRSGIGSAAAEPVGLRSDPRTERGPVPSLRFEVFASWLAVLFEPQRRDVARTRQKTTQSKNRKEKTMRTFFRRAGITTFVSAGAGLMGFFIASAVPGVTDAALASSTSHAQVGCYGNPSTAPHGASSSTSTSSSTTGSAVPSGTAGPSVSTGTAGTTGTTGTTPTTTPVINISTPVASPASGSQSGTGTTGTTGSGTATGTGIGTATGPGTLVNVSTPVASPAGASQPDTGTLVNVTAPVSSSPGASQSGTGTGTGSGTDTGNLVNVAAPVSSQGVTDQPGTGSLVNVAAPVSSAGNAAQSGTTTGTGNLVNVATPVSSGTTSQTGTGDLVNVLAPVSSASGLGSQ
jgi:hypothetical protein